MSRPTAAAPVTGLPRRLAALFLVAAAGVLFALGLLAAAAGPLVLAVYAAALVVLVVLAVRRADRLRRSAAAARQARGRTCTCCTGSVHDPVQVV